MEENKMKNLFRICASVMLAIALLMGAVESVFEVFTPQAAAAASKRTARKTSQAKKSAQSAPTSAKPATATRAARVISLQTVADLEKVARKGTVKFFEQYGCYKAVLGQTITVSECATVIVTEKTKQFRAGTTVKAGTKLTKGTPIKVCFKKSETKTAKAAAPKEAMSEGTVTPMKTIEAKPAAVARPAIVTNTRFLLAFSTLAHHQGKVVDGRLIAGESDLSLIAQEAFRDTHCQVRFMLRAERAFVVREENFYATVYDGNGKVRDIRDGKLVRKGEMVTIIFRNLNVVTRFAQPEAPEVVNEPIATSQETSTAESEPEPAVSQIPGYVGILEQAVAYGDDVQLTPGFVGMKMVTNDFSVNPDYTVRIRARDGHWINVKPGDNGLVTIKAGTQSVYIFKNVLQARK